MSQPINALQQGEVLVVKRSQIKEAPYNPRQISEAAFDRLFKAVGEHGIVADPTWNVRTGNLVGGHQRLKAMDKSMGYPRKVKDYDVRVLAIDVDELTEKKLNVILNNPSAQGEWDLDKLGALSLEDGLSLEDDLLFTSADVDFMFEGDSRFSELVHDIKDVAAAKDEVAEIKESRKEAVQKFESTFLGSYHFVIVCESHQEKENLLRALGVSVYEEFVGAHAVTRSLNETSKAAFEQGMKSNPPVADTPPSHDEPIVGEVLTPEGGEEQLGR